MCNKKWRLCGSYLNADSNPINGKTLSRGHHESVFRLVGGAQHLDGLGDGQTTPLAFDNLTYICAL